MQKEVENIIVEKNEEGTYLKDHNKKLLTQIKKLEDDNNSLKNKFEELIAKEASNYSDVAVKEKVMNIDLVNITIQEYDN